MAEESRRPGPGHASQSPDPLDLSITLAAPPQDSPPEILATLLLRCDQLGLSPAGDLLADPLTKEERDDLQWYLEEYWQWPFEGFAERGKQIEALLPQIGTRLYRAVFGSLKASSLVQAWRLHPATRHQVSVVSEIPAVLSLPWELLHDSSGFLARGANPPVSIVRRLPQPEQTALTAPFAPPLRILLITARPEGPGFLDPRNIASELVDEVHAQVESGALDLEFLRPATLAALLARLKDTSRPIHVLHFDGHGVFDEEGHGQGLLLFETEAGQPSPVMASDLARVLRNRGIRLVILTACQSAVHAADDALSSVAAQLIGSGVDAVVAMSASFLVASATRYVEAFYHALAAGTPVPTAQEQARQVLADDPRRHLLRRSGDTEGSPIELHDWWVPHFYQQRPLALQPTRPVGRRKQQAGTPLPRLNEDMPREPRYGFSGRARELLQLERSLLRGKLVVLHGFGGVGKTALAREAADWLTRTGMYEGACFVSFEGGRGSASSLLSQLGFFLGIQDGTYTPDGPKAALQQLEAVLKDWRTLVIADNLESILPGGEAELSAEERTELWNTLLDLQRLGAGVLLTTRTTTFGDGRLAVGAQAMYLQLEGLGHEDAYQLASSLLTSLQIDRRRSPYHLLRELLQQLGYHPLSIQLILPVLRTHELWQILQDFVTLLPQFADDAETGHNRSLLASLEYSLQRLSEKQRELLSLLAVFEGGVMENNLLNITEMAESDWAELRKALEQAALLRVERLKGVNFPFLHFHPVLIPYLRGEAPALDEALKARYVQVYYRSSNYYYWEDKRHPRQIRAIVQRELPNLRRAFGWLLESGDLEQSAWMATFIDCFLDIFGLHREQQRVHERVAEALSALKSSTTGVLTLAEYLHETSLGEEELREGHLQTALARFQRLLAHIESEPEGHPRGPGSFEHTTILGLLGQCLQDEGNLAEAEPLYRRASVLFEVLVQHDPENQRVLRQQAVLLAHLGDVLRRQGVYAEAKKAHEQALQIKERIGDLQGQAVSQVQLGTIALEQREYPEARTRYQQALHMFHALGEPAMEAVVWHRLGTVAQREQNWSEAERGFRKSLSLYEQLGDRVGAARTYSHLGQVAVSTNRFAEAKGWYQRAVWLTQQADATSGEYASHLSNLADCLIREVQKGAVQDVSLQLEEAGQYAEQALVIDQGLQSPDLWKRFSLLATIAEMQGRHEVAHAYRHQKREAYASFAGHRYQIDQQFRKLFPLFAAAQDDLEVRAQMEELLSQFEAEGWHISEALQRIWVGERDWQALVKNLGNKEALFVLRVLETLAEGADTTKNALSPEQYLSTLPSAIREALAAGDQQAFLRAFEVLSAQEQQSVIEFIHTQEVQQRDEKKEFS